MVGMACSELVQAMQQRTSRMVRRVRVIHALLRNVGRMDRVVHGAHLKTYGELMGWNETFFQGSFCAGPPLNQRPHEVYPVCVGQPAAALRARKTQQVQIES